MKDPLNARSILRSYGIAPKKKMGQNFIVRRSALDQVMHAAQVDSQERVIEIGSGVGALTIELAKRASFIHAIEMDGQLIPILRDMLVGYENVNIIQADFLRLDLEDLLAQPSYCVVANIPYQITSAVIRKIVGAPFPAERVVLTIQREVAERVIAAPGDLSLLAISVQIFGEPSIHSHIAPEAFYPQPKVDSSVLHIDMFSEPRVPLMEVDHFFRIAKAGFSQKRKKLRNALAAGLQIPASEVEAIMEGIGLSPALRAQALSVDQWLDLSGAFRGVV